MKLVIVVLVLALSLLARCQDPSTVVAEFRYLDYMQEDQRCEITIAAGKKITTCGSALQTYSEFIIGGGRELFIETNETRYGPAYPTGPGTASTSIRASFRQWQTDFGQGMGGISEYTLDGFGSNPDEIDVGNDDDWGLSPRNGNNDTDFTANGGYALYFEISTQFQFRMDISIFDNQERLLNFTLEPASVSSNVFIPYIVPFSFFEYANASASVGQFDLTHIGALDLFAYQVENNDFGLRFLGIFGHTISGKAYLDCDTDCTQDVAEPIRQVFVELTDITNGETLIDSTTTDAVTGMYQFTVANGQYRICLRDFDFTDYSPCFTTSNSSNANCYVVFIPTVPDPSDPSIDVDLIFTDYPGYDFPFVPVSSISDPPDTPITCADDPNSPSVPRATVSSSECGGSGSVTWMDQRFRCNAASSAGTILRTYTASFGGGGTATTTQVITVVDQGPPVFIQPVPASTTLTCNPAPCTSTGCLGMAGATDDCSTPAVTSFDSLNPSTCSDVITRTFVATDPCGPTSFTIQTITIQDNDSPNFTNFPTDRTVTCFDLANGTNLGADPGAVDPCQGTLTAGMITGPQQSSSPGACGSIMRTWTAIDGCGHSTTRTQTLTVQDNQPPVIVAPAPTTITCGDNNPNLGTFSVSDNCASSPSDIATGLTVQQGPGSDSCGSFVRVFTARDSCNPQVSATQVVTVVDGVPPYFVTTPPPQVTFDCQTSNTNAPVLTLADDCSGVSVSAISASTTQPSGPACDQTFLRIWTGQDNCGTPTTFTQTVHLTDPDPPILSLPPTTSIACTGNRSPGANNPAGTATAYDVCSDSVRPVSFTDTPPGSCQFSIIRTYSASDSCDNTATGSQILNIFDDVPPTFSNFPADISVPCSSGSIPVQQPTPTDNCNAVENLTYRDTPNGAACPALITITRTWSVQDSCGNPTSRDQTITLTDDAPPVATAPPSQTIPCSSGTDPSVLGTATFRLGCPAREDESLVRVTFFDARSQNSCPTTILRTWTVTDGCGQTDTDVQIITLIDNLSPVFDQDSLPPAAISVHCGEDFPPVNILFSDNCDPDPQLTTTTSSPVPGNQEGQCPADTQVTRTWTITDNCGNSDTYSQVITIDNTPPSPCTPVDCVPQPCDTSACPDQNCDCCSGEQLPCSPVPCSSAPCSSTPCIAVPCSGCDFPTQVTTCQPRVCPPQYIYINDDDAAAANRAGISQVKKVKNYPGVSGASNLVVSIVLLVAVLFSAILTLF